MIMFVSCIVITIDFSDVKFLEVIESKILRLVFVLFTYFYCLLLGIITHDLQGTPHCMQFAHQWTAVVHLQGTIHSFYDSHIIVV